MTSIGCKRPGQSTDPKRLKDSAEKWLVKFTRLCELWRLGRRLSPFRKSVTMHGRLIKLQRRSSSYKTSLP